MQTKENARLENNNHKIVDYDAVLDAEFGAVGTEERTKHEAEAKAFYAGQLLLQARREAGVSQSELASRVGTNKSYISKIENGVVEPGVGLYSRLMEALGMRLEVVSAFAM